MGPCPAAPEIEFQVDRARSGAASLCLGGRRVHSLYDPLREAEARAEGILREAADAAGITLIGAGLGYLPQALARRARVPVVVWEPFGGVRAALAEWIGSEVEVVTTPQAFDRALRRALPQRGHAFPAVHPGYEELTRFEQRYALRSQRRMARERGVRAACRGIVSVRALDSLRRLPGLRPISELAGLLAGRSVVVASGGPSLDLALPALCDTRSVPLVAAPQALSRLLGVGLRPDFAISVDPQDLLTPVLGERGAPFGALLADTSAHPATLDRCPDRCFLFHLRSPQILQRVWEHAGLPVIDEPLITVSELAVHLTRELGARRVLLAGVDFVSESRLYGAPFRVRGAAGGLVSTNPHYFHGARYLAGAVSGVEMARVGAGVDLPGVRRLEVEELRDWLARAEQGPPLELPEPSPAGVLEGAARALLAESPPREAANAMPGGGPWDDFLPLASDRIAAEWKALRSELEERRRRPGSAQRRSGLRTAI